MKFVCLKLWLEEVCTDDANDADSNDDANTKDAQSMIVLVSLVDKPNEPKIQLTVHII